MEQQNPEKVAAENRFIEANREHIATFGTQQYQATGSKGAVLIRRARPQDDVGQVHYLTRDQMRSFGLLGEGGPAIQQSVTAALNQYDPAEEVVLIFLYDEDATAYLLNRDDLLEEEE